MQRIENYVEKAKASNKILLKIKQVMPVLSLVVITSVFWSLKLIGITLAGEAFCGKEEHVHDEFCGQPALVCELTETEGHYHTDNCLAQQLVCVLEEIEGHVHQDTCYNRTLVCTAEETDEHHHDETCHNSEVICTIEESEGHSHSEECYAKAEFICQQSETEGHLHTVECVADPTALICGLEITEPHLHNENCYGQAEECILEEHIHLPECYSDINADIETQSQWEETISGVLEGACPQENILAVASSQLGYTESEKNFELDENGEKNGYTRYGQWYGNPYGQWNTMFVSFCLHYSKIEGIPLSAGAETMRLEWENIELYVPAQDILPSAGDLIFLDKNTNGAADAVAIVSVFEEGQIRVIEGDFENSVAETVYSVEDASIMGYGVIPDMSGVMTLEARAATPFAKTEAYSSSIFSGNSNFVIYTQSNGAYYAIDGDGNAQRIYIDADGNITSDLEDNSDLLWTVTSYSGSSYYVQNVSTSKYLYPNSGAVDSSRNRATFSSSSGGVTIRGTTGRYASLNGTKFTNASSGSVFYFGKTPESYYVWLDGTNGGLYSVSGSDNKCYTCYKGDKIKLPSEWKTPEKYHYKVRGWYDVTNGIYYLPETEVEVTGNMVFYVDWVPATYDIGEYDRETVNTVSSAQIITTRLFDFNALFNVMSANPTSISISADSHKETWTGVQTGNVEFDGRETINFMFVDQESGGTLHTPNSRGSNSSYQNAVTTGIYSPELAEILFSTDNCYDPETKKGMVGKTYLGTGDYLFQYGTDPNSEYYGYYYYDSKLNAASYNMSEQRFYVYDYLEATRDTRNSSTGLESDFLPLNSIYANTNDKKVITYQYSGVNGEYEGVDHYQFDSQYNTNGNSVENAITNYSFGLSMDVKFYLPGVPGSKDEDNKYKNCDVYGKEMIFKFAGDDDVWVLVDGELVMDIGGIHQIEAGEINFATGVVTVDGRQQRTITDMSAGEHTLTLYYLDRGGSMSNCAMYYSIAPRYSLNIQKEDVLTQQLLNGAKFAVYTDEACTQPAELWRTEDDYHAGKEAEESFNVTNGTVDIWGLAAGGTYYIKELKPPDEENYDDVYGIIRFKVGKSGIATYDVEIIEEKDEDGNPIPISSGFTVHGIHIDEGQQKAKIIVTNAQEWIKETTSVQIVKVWEDDKDHSGDYVTVYLTVTEDDGTVRRIREITLSDENQWRYLWTGLPKYELDPETGMEDKDNPVDYGVDEAYEEGYYSRSKAEGKIEINKAEWGEYMNDSLEAGKYLLKSGDGYLSTTSTADTNFKLVDEVTAKNSPLAQWNVTVKNGRVKFTNDEGQIITLNTSGGYKYVASKTSNNSTQEFTVNKLTGGGFRFSIKYSRYTYYIGGINSTGGSLTAQTSSSRAENFQLFKLVTKDEVIEIKDLGFKITNTPLVEETSMTVRKEWSAEAGYGASYREELVTVRLLANGEDTGRTVTLMLKNNWTDTFRGLPYKDENGNVITYTVQEVWKKQGWVVSYGPIQTSSGNVPTYSTTVINTYIPMGPALPSTGSFARQAYIYCGGGIMLTSLICGIRLRRRKERRLK